MKKSFFARTRAAALLVLLAPGAGIGAGTHLTYYGGPVVSNLQVVQVNWGSSLAADMSTQMPTFYADIVQSDYLTILSEYATNITAAGGGPGTNQQIGLGTFAGLHTITPSVCSAPPCTLSDTQIQNELAAQVAAGHLPAPTTDAGGNVNTIYMVHFATSVKITQFGAQSCASGGFCATWTDVGIGGLNAPAGLIPDQELGGCSSGCGTAPTAFDRETHIGAYMLANISTNPDAPVSATVAAPLAWFYNNVSMGGNIADICSASSEATTTVGGHSYDVPKLWSNKGGACIATGPQRVVKPSASAHGTISPDLPQGVTPGNSIAFAVTPDPTFSAVVGGTCGGTLSGTTFTTSVINADCTVDVDFIDRIFASGFEG